MSKKVVKAIEIFVLVATFAVLIECVFFQRNALRYKEEPCSFAGSSENIAIETKETVAKLTDEEENAILVERENERLIAEYHGEEYTPKEDETLVEKNGKFYRRMKQTTITLSLESDYYINKLSLSLPLEESGGYHVVLYQDGAEKKSGMYCSIDPKIDTGVMNVNAFADEIVITLNTIEDLQMDELNITLSNNFSINIMRVLFLFVLLFIIVFLIVETVTYGLHFELWKNMKKNQPDSILVRKPEWVFACICFMLGSLLILGIGTNQVGFDEYSYAKTAYDLYFGSTIETKEAAMQMKGNLLPFFNNPEERALVEEYEQRMVEEIAPDITHQSRMVRTETRVYYPMAAGFYVARLVGADFATSVAFAKYGNLIMYIAVVWLAIYLAKRYKLLVILIGLLPNNIFIASSITYDAVVTAFLLLATVFMTNELLEPRAKLKWKNVLAMLICFEIGCLSKPIYIVMALMLLFFGKEKFENRGQEVVLKLSVIVMAGLMLYNIFKPTPVSGGAYALVSDFSYAGDPRNTGSSVTGQISYILANPIAYSILLLKSMGTMFLNYVTAKTPFVGYAYLGFTNGFINWIFIILAFLSAIYSSREDKLKLIDSDDNTAKKSAIGMKNVILNLIMCFGVSAIIWTSMYVSYTAVGADVIEGVQGRYFIPLFLPFFSCFFIKNRQKANAGKISKWWNQIEPTLMYAVIIGIAVLINLVMTYTLVITRLNV